MLTGANSGGKTTLLTTVATIHLLTLLGLPVPADSAEVNPVPIYLFRRRTTKRVGSLEQALRSLIPVFADTQPKLILLDEFEALTEPGAAGRIVASIINHVATGSISGTSRYTSRRRDFASRKTPDQGRWNRGVRN